MKILFVCTGNTCRSPMAQVMAAQLFGEGFEIISAGVMAMSGVTASAHAIAVMNERQLDLMKHQSQPVTDDLLASVDLILTMTTGHKGALSQNAGNKAYTLGEYAGNKIAVSDPFGGDIEVYRTCADEIHELLLKIQDKIKKFKKV